MIILPGHTASIRQDRLIRPLAAGEAGEQPESSAPHILDPHQAATAGTGASLDYVATGVYTICMHRVNFHLTDRQRAILQRVSASTGLPVAELIRRAVDAYLKRKGT